MKGSQGVQTDSPKGSKTGVVWEIILKVVYFKNFDERESVLCQQHG